MSKSTKIIAALGVIAGLGVAALPLGAFAESQDVDVKITVKSSVSIAVEENDIPNPNFDPTQPEDPTTNPRTIKANDVVGEMENNDVLEIAGGTTVKVTTNDAAGYIISVKDKDSDTNLNLAGGSDTFGAFASSIATLPAKGHNDDTKAGWGIKSAQATNVSFSGGYMGVTAANQEIRRKAGTANQDETSISYAFVSKVTQTPGVYSDTITYTATANE